MGKSHYPEIDAELVGEIVAFLRANDVRSVHYWGNAAEGMLRALLALPGIKISCSDERDRWGASARFWYEEDQGLREPKPRPEWLYPVTFMIEGQPPEEVWLQDTAWGEFGSVSGVLADRLRRSEPPPRFMVLVGAATQCDQHPDFLWEHCSPMLLIGRHAAYERQGLSRDTARSGNT